MIKFFVIIIVLTFLNNCSLNKNSSLWDNKEKELEAKKNYKKVFSESEKIVSEFNQDLKIDLKGLITKNKIIDDQNNFGSQKYDGLFNKIGVYKFSKFNGINKIDSKPIFISDGIIFFDKKGSIIRYDKNQKVVWKRNHYLKSERKLQPKLDFILSNQNILVTDSIAKYYSIDLNTGDLNWLKNSTYPFNSEIKKYKDKIFVIDYKNTLRCFKMNDGSECWNLQTEDSFRISNSKYSLIVTNDMVVFSNSLGDITAVDTQTGLILWQLPTQSRNIANETHNFKMSNLVSDSNSIFFSNSKNEFYSIDLKTGTPNWKNEIISNITPIILKNLLFSISKDGFLYVIEKKNGNIIRVTDVYSDYRFKNKDDINPIGFAIGDKNLYLSNGDGKIIVINLSYGRAIKVEKISGGFLSKPFIFNNNLFVVKNGSILQYN